MTTTELSRAPEREAGKALLLAVCERLADEARWTKGFAARDAAGDPTQCEKPDAACFCIVGAFWRESAKLNDIRASNAFAVRLGFGDWETLAEWNDAPERTHAEVLARLDAAIEATP